MENEQENLPTSSQPDIPLLQATIDSLSKEVTLIKDKVDKQRSESQNIIIAVVVAALLIFLGVAVEVVLFHTRSDDGTLNIQREMYDQLNMLKEQHFQNELKIQELNNFQEVQKKVEASKYDETLTNKN